MAIKLKVCVARPRALLPLLAAAALLLLRCCCCCCRFRLGFASFCRAFACVCELASSFAVAVVVVVVRRRHLLSATSNRLFHLPPSTRSSPTHLAWLLFICSIQIIHINCSFFCILALLSLSFVLLCAIFYSLFFIDFYSLCVLMAVPSRIFSSLARFYWLVHCGSHTHTH